MTKLLEREIKVKGTGSQCMLEKYVENNYYTTFDTRSYHHYRETHFKDRLDVKSWQKSMEREI